MTKYEIISRTIPTGETKYVIRNHDLPWHPYFAEYNFMGGVDWDTDVLGAYYMDIEEATQIKADLESADADDQPKKVTLKQYLVKTSINGEPINRIMTATEIVDLYEQDQLSGVYGEIKVWDLTKDEPVRMNLLQMVEPVIAQRRWEEQEYRDYCENERY